MLEHVRKEDKSAGLFGFLRFWQLVNISHQTSRDEQRSKRCVRQVVY